MKPSYIKTSIGVAFMLAGIFVPATAIVGLLRQSPVDAGLLEQLLLGATLFKYSLAALGLFILIAHRLPIWSSQASTERPLFETVPRTDLMILATILLVSTALRFYGLGGGLWFDEIVTYVKYVQVPFGEAISTYDNQNQHILYSLLANLAFYIFGESVWALRLPAVLFGTGSIWALYLLGREVANSREALLSAALLAFSYHHVWFSQNARGYTGLLFWTILASWLFLRAVREGRPQLWVLYAAAVALGAYTLIYMAFVAMGHLAIYGVTLYARRERESMRTRLIGLTFGFGLAGFLTFFLHSLILPQFLSAFTHAEVGGPVWTQPLWGILEFVNGMRINFSGSVMALFALALFGGGLWHYARTRPEVVALLIIPSVTCVALKVAMGHHLWPRSLFFIMGFGALVVVRGIMVFGRLLTDLSGRLELAAVRSLLGGADSSRLGTAMCSGLVLLSAASVPFAYGPKQDYLGAMDFIEASRAPGDSVVTVGLATFPYKNLYKPGWEEAETVEALNSIRSRSNKTWLVYTIPIQLQDSFPEVDATIKQDFTVIKQFSGTLHDGTIYVCQPNPALTHIAGLK